MSQDNTYSSFVRCARLVSAVLLLGATLSIFSPLTGPAPRTARAAVELKLDACEYGGSGTTWTSNPGPVNGSLVGSPAFSGTEGSYFTLNGTSQYVSLPHNSVLSLSTSASRTFQVWLKPTSLPTGGSQRPILGKLSSSYGWDGYLLYLRTDGYLNFHTNGTGIAKDHTSTTNPLVAGQWHLVTVVSQISSAAGSTKIYVNGTNVVSSSHGSDGYSESNTLYVGGTSFSEFLPAWIGAFHAYDRALSAAEISASYTAFSNRVSSGACNQSVPEVSSFTSAQATPTNSTSFSYALTFSEAVTGVAGADFTNAGTAAGCSFDPGSDASSATRTVTVTGCGDGTVRPRFAMNGATNASSSTGPSAAATASTIITRDATGPSLLNGSLGANGRTVTLNFDESLGSTTAPAGAFRVTAVAANHTPTAVAVSGSSAELTLPVTLEGSVAVTVSYTAPASNPATSNSALQDDLGNDAPSFSGRNLTNNSTADGTAPTATWTAPSSPSSSRTLSYTLTFSESVSGISAGDFQNLGTASGCTFSPSAASTSASITVSVTCTSDGTVIANIAQNSVVDGNSNTGPDLVTTASTVTISTTPATTSTTTTVPVVTTTIAPAQAPATTAPGVPQAAGTTSTTTTVASRSITQSTTATSSATLPTTPTTTTSTSVPPSTTTTSTLPPITVPETETGGASALVGGVRTDAVITRENNQLVVKAGPISARFRGTAADGGLIPLDADGRLRMRNGDSVTVEVEGFDAGSTVEVRLYSEPVLLGRSNVDAAGSLIGSYEIPEGTPPGDHRIVLAGERLGDPATFALSVAIGAEQAGINPLVIILPLGAAILGAMLLPVALRRRRGNA